MAAARFLIFGFLLLLLPLHAFPQSATPSPTPLLRFEVVSIRPHHFSGDDPSNRRMQPGGRFVATATTARTLLRIAFGTDDNRMSGAPGWIDTEAFDMDAVTADHAEVKTPEQFQQLILSLLEDRFQLKFNREQKDGPVYRLEVNKPGRLGPGLVPSPPTSQPNMSVNSNGARVAMKASKASMADLAAALRRQAGRPVEDGTGLTGSYDLQAEWDPKDTPDSSLPSLFGALQQQLGLKLVAARGLVETIAIDRIARPSDN